MANMWFLQSMQKSDKNQTMFLSKNLDHYLSLYDNIIILGDFNTEPVNTYMNEFMNMYGLNNLVNEPTCYQNVNNPSCIDLILTNRSKSFQKTTAIETGLSDFHKMTITIMKTVFKRPLWACDVVVSMFDFHRSDRGSNPGRGGKFS